MACKLLDVKEVTVNMLFRNDCLTNFLLSVFVYVYWFLQDLVIDQQICILRSRTAVDVGPILSFLLATIRLTCNITAVECRNR